VSPSKFVCVAASVAVLAATASLADVRIVSEHNDNASAAGSFRFKNVPSSLKNDAAAKASFAIVDGVVDRNSGGVEKLRDGSLPVEDDQPAENFFFNAGTDGGRLQVDLGGVIEIKQVNTYSWHSSDRGPQLYKLYASDGTDAAFDTRPQRGNDPGKCGWKLVASVDTRPTSGERGGQYGVSISNPDGTLGKHRYLLFDCSRTESDDAFGNTFYSEIDVVDANAPPTEEAEIAQPPQPITKTFAAEGGKYQFSIDTTLAPDLTEWAERELAPVTQEWYPKIVKMLPSEGYEAPTRVTITFRDNMGGTPASAAGSRINCNIGWFRRNLKGEAIGSVVHEMVHVVQQYGRGRRDNPNATRTPGWVTEGIPDYIRWFLYEPQSKGAEITARNFSRARYDGNYRITANFLNSVIEKYDKDLHLKLNAAARQAKYTEDLWKDYTGKTLQELGDEWRETHRIRLGLPAESDAAISPGTN
jgi:hypothetical protein